MAGRVMRPVVIIAASACALAGAGLAGLVWLRPPSQPVATVRQAEPKPFSMEQFRRDSRNQSYSDWADRQRQAWKDCPRCPPLPLPDVPHEEPAFEDVAPPKQNLPSQARPRAPAPMPPVKPLPDWAKPKPKPAKAKGWDI